MEKISCDLAIIGAGPGGYVSAIRAAQMSLKVCIIEKNQIGGTCLNRGCIPSKALLSCAAKLKSIQSAEEFGISANNISFDFKRMVERKNKIVDILRNGITSLFKKHFIFSINGEGIFENEKLISVKTNTGDFYSVEAKNIIIAAGSEPLTFPQFNFDGIKIITSTEALNIEILPKSIVIAGGGIIGCEFASLFSTFGVDVTIAEAYDRLIPTVDIDDEIVKQITNLFRRSGIKMKLGKKIKEINKIKIEDGETKVKIIFEDGEETISDMAMISIGRSLNSGKLGMENTQIQTGRNKEIIVDEHLRTSSGNIYAIGDITNKMQLAHTASRQGIIAVENIMGKNSAMTYDSIPWAIYTLPNMASVGLSEKKASEKGFEPVSGIFNFRALGKARASGETEGLVKFVADKKTDKILGVHIIGSCAAEIIHESAVAISNSLTISNFLETVHAHPSLSEALYESAENVHGMGIHS